MPKWSNQSLVIVLAKNVGMIKGAQVLQFIWSWGDVMERLGREPDSIEEYADTFRTSYATAYREQKLFREALPGETTPTRIWKDAKRQHASVRDAKTGPARLGTLKLT